MRFFAIPLSIFAASALVLAAYAGQKPVGPDPQGTLPTSEVRTLLNNVGSNFNEVYAGTLDQEALTFAASITVDFSRASFKTVTLTGTTTLAFSNLRPGATIVIRATNSAAAGRTVNVPTGVKFVGLNASASTPATVSPSLLIFRSFGTTAADVTCEVMHVATP